MTKERLVRGYYICDADYQLVVRTSRPRATKKYFAKGSKLDIICPFYKRWRSMITRAVDSRGEITICDEWRRFSNFKKWMEIEGMRYINKTQLHFKPFAGLKHFSPSTVRCISHLKFKKALL
jgi:hypothetical protein